MTFKEQLEKVKDSSLKRIAEYLLTRSDLQSKLDNKNKSIEKMYKYVFWKAKKEAESKSSICIDDDIVFGWAVHYYDEDKTELDIDNEKKKAEFEEKKKASEKEKIKELNEDKEPIKLEDVVKPYKPKKVKAEIEGQLSLF